MNEEENKRPKTEEKDNIMYDNYNEARSKIIAYIGVIITIVAIGVVFFISSLEGTREVKSGNYKSGKILNVWREDTGLEDGFPDVRSDIVAYDGREYYFIEEYDEDGNVEDWYFAFEGGLQYVFSDYKYYVLTAIVATVAIFVSYINYVSSKNNAKTTDRFFGALKYYKKAKEDVRGFFHLIPRFCIDKKLEARVEKVRDIVEEANILYEDYLDKENFQNIKLEKWQKKILKKIRKIKIKSFGSTDLLQEKSIVKGNTIRMLPADEKETEKSFLIKTSVQKFITIGLSGAVVAFGVVLGNWALGITYGFTVAIGAVSSSIAGADYVFNTLRNRYIGKADFLIEFYGVKENYIEKETDLTVKTIDELKEGEPNG